MQNTNPYYHLAPLVAPGMVPSPIVKRRETMTSINPNDSGNPDDDKPSIVAVSRPNL